MTLKITQGDAYPIPFLLKQAGQYLTPDMIQDVEVSVGSTVLKKLSDGEVMYQEDTWYFYLSQEETFSLDGNMELEIRVRYKDQPFPVVLSKRAGFVKMDESNSKEVL